MTTVFALQQLLDRVRERAQTPPPPPVVVNVDLAPLAQMLASQTLKVKDVDGVRIVPS